MLTRASIHPIILYQDKGSFKKITDKTKVMAGNKEVTAVAVPTSPPFLKMKKKERLAIQVASPPKRPNKVPLKLKLSGTLKTKIPKGINIMYKIDTNDETKIGCKLSLANL